MTKKAKQAPSTNISEKFINQFYSIQAEVYSPTGEKLEIPESGFLGLLATGYKGLAMHRKKQGLTHLYYKFTKGKKLPRKRPIQKRQSD